MKETSRRVPKVLVPFLGIGKKNQMDVVIYLRPETNGVDVESLLFQDLFSTLSWFTWPIFLDPT